ncbi:sucrase ferredoxin [Paenibacillus sp. y28]|uniref:sucrase ferredoxin n=1 Tax=Paenibacillus sp. y28 TaxID=3129110 RepID=UPI0030195D09
MKEPLLPDELCSVVSLAAQEDPCGTAVAHERYVLIEVPLPWENDLTASRYFPAVLKDALQQAKERGITFRLLGFAPEKEQSSPPGLRRIQLYTRPAAPFAEYLREEFVMPEEKLGALIAAAFGLQPQAVAAEAASGREAAAPAGGAASGCSGEQNGEAGTAGAAAGASPSLAPFAAYACSSDGIRDLFVCTHGTYDICCGKLGYPVYQALRSSHEAGSEGRLRVWRVNHIGGHRLAPTLVDFPSGRYWGPLQLDSLDELVNQRGDAAALYRQYRGWGGLQPHEQRVDREIWQREGWEWMSYERFGTSRQQEDGTTHVQIHFRRPGSASDEAYEAYVRETGEITITGCHMKEALKCKQYEVFGLVKLC